MESHELFTIIALAENKPGVLNRVSSLLRRRRFNIESLTAGHTHQAGISSFTIVMRGTRADVDQIVKQMYKIIEITKVIDLSQKEYVGRELALIKVSSSKTSRSEIIELTDIFRGKIVDVAHDSLIIEITGTVDKVDSFIELLQKFGIQEIGRTGITALVRE